MTPRSEIDPLDLLAEDFVERLRRGERPSLTEYTARLPDAADRIRELFPALAAMEGAAEALTNIGSASAVTEVEQSALPERIGDYRILREVGRGGMGVVYEAEQVSLGRHVALKVLLPECQARGRFLERFRREARAAGRLHHTNIVPVFGVGETDGAHYYVMQFIRGVGLDQVIRDVRRLRRDPANTPDLDSPATDETLSVSVANGLLNGQAVAPAAPASSPDPTGPMDASSLTWDGGYYKAVARLALQAARALDHAHGHGVVHRDVKPSNMLLDAQGNLWVTDFGLAKTDEASDLTGSHDILGTMRYMSPERFAGAAIDARADIYALGLTLYELLVLRPAFHEYDRLRLIQQIAEGGFRRPREFDPRVPRDLETIVLKAAARDSKDRYRTAAAVAEDLELFLANRPIKSRRASSWEHLRRWAKRNPVVAGLAGAVAFLLVAITALTLANNARLGRTNKDLDAKSTALGHSLTEQESLRVRAQDEAWHARIEATRAGRFSGRQGQRFEGVRNLEKALELAPGRELLTVRNEAVGCLTLPDAEAIAEVPWPYGTTRVTFTRDMSRYARVGTDGRITVRRVADDHEFFELPQPGPPNGYHGWRFSPDGRYFWNWNLRDNRIRVWQVNGEKPIEVLDLDGNRVTGLDYTADSARLAVADSGGNLRLFDLYEPDPARRAQPTIEVRPGADKTTGTVWAHPKLPDVLLLTGNAQMTLYDLSRRVAIYSRNVPENARVSWVAWHPEGIVYAVAGNDAMRRVYVCSAETGATLTTLNGHTTNGILVGFDPAGDRLWSTDWTNQTRLWDWRSGRQIFEASAGVAIPPTIAADGSLAGVLRGNRAQVWRVAAGRETTRMMVPSHLPVGKSAIRGSPVISPDGRLLAAPCDDLLALYDLHARELVGSIPLYKAMPVRFEADGSALLVFANLGKIGLYRIPLARTGSTVQVGQPQLLVPLDASAVEVLGLSDDGRILAVPRHSDGVRLYRDPAGPSVDLGRQHDVRFCSVSPDGRWVISGSHGEGSVVLWDATSGRHVKELEDWGGHSSFSRDGRWACTFRNDTHSTRIWDTTTWESCPVFAGERGVFSPDGKYLAVGGEAGVVRLVHVPDGEEVVRLSVPDNVQFFPACFSTDGSTIVAMAFGPGFVQAWDLHAIRRQLQPMGLDWDDAPLPNAPPEPFRYPARLTVLGPPPTKSSIDPPAVTGDPLGRWVTHSLVIAQHPLHPAGYVRRAEASIAMNRFDEALVDADTAIRLAPEGSDGYRVRGHVRRALGDLRAALADFDRAVEFDPDSRQAHADRANAALRLHDDPTFLASARRMTELSSTNAGWWALLAVVRLVGDESMRDVPAGLAAAERAVQFAPTNAYNHTIFGYALFESGQVSEAAKQFAESRRLKPAMPYEAMNLFGLALCAHQGGDRARARAWFAQAVAGKGRFSTEMAGRLFDQIYGEASQALGLPPPPMHSVRKE